jgi:CRISPR system Cascade subunit CasD
MSSNIAHLALRLQGPLQAWGLDSQYSRRNSALLPTKSAILGMCLAALGVDRGSAEEQALLEKSVHLRLLVVAVPPKDKRYRQTDAKVLPVRRITDYHTVMHTRSADGNLKKDAVLTYRQYLCDAAFACVVSGEPDLVSQLGQAMENPVWGLWLGRKSCIPSAPIFVGVFPSEQDALSILLEGRPLENFTRQREAGQFVDGGDSLPDQPVCFAAPDGIRKFALRRIKLEEAEQ